MTKQLNIGMVGYGFMARAHSNAWANVSHFFDTGYRPVLKAVAARNASKVRHFAEAWGKMADETELETRRKRLLYRSVYRGNKENDILLGQFARAHIGGFGAAELDQYEKLLQAGDNDIYDWVAGKTAPPAEADTPVLRLLMAFRVRF